MKTQTYTRIMTGVCAAALASCASAPVPTRTQVSASLRPDSSTTSRVFQEVNAYRRSCGAKELQRHAGLDRLAQEHCEFLRRNRGTFSLNGKNVSHFGFEGRNLIARERYRMSNVSENVAATSSGGHNPSAALIDLWKGSKDHHKNMLDDWTYTGVGLVVDSDGMAFSTQLFSNGGYSEVAPRDRFNRF